MDKIRFVYSPAYCVDIGAHVFRTNKYRRLHDRLVERHAWAGDAIEAPLAASGAELRSALEPAYLDDLLNLRWTERTMHSELPLTREIVDGAILTAGGTLIAARRALAMRGIGYHIGGGWHHAFPGHAEGFCYINDVAVALRVLLKEKAIARAMVVDCDLHQGNGTAAYFLNDPAVFTFSIHEEELYPQKQQSDLDIGLPAYAGDDVYLRALDNAVPRIYDEHRPDLLIYVAGADPFEGDQLGTLALTKEGLRARDERVLFEAAKRKIPVVVTLAGGYAAREEDLIDVHWQTIETAVRAAEMYE